MNQFISFALIFVIIGCFVNANSQMDPSSQLSQELAEFAVKEMGSGHQLISVISIKKKIVAGTMYYMHIKIRKFKPGGFDKIKECQVQVWDQGLSRKVKNRDLDA